MIGNGDTPVMLLFFNRPDLLTETFAWVKTVKPKQLFLVQDGARKGNLDDEEKIVACRKIVSDISWDCEVRRNYANYNMTCDNREFTGIDWCFQYVDRLIILEDDCKPAVSFYALCEELLEKYKEDRRIHMISGFARTGVYRDSPYDYVFSQSGAGWGWATWKRVWQQVKELYKWEILESQPLVQYYSRCVDQSCAEVYRGLFRRAGVTKMRDEEAGFVTSWEMYLGMAMCMNGSLTITPSKNMVQYLGVSSNATHTPDNELLLAPKIRKVLTQKANEVTFPLRHPPFVVRDRNFEYQEARSMKDLPEWIRKIRRGIVAMRLGRWDLLKRN